MPASKWNENNQANPPFTNMKSRFQKFTLLAHIACSVGWFGAIIPYLALVIAGLTSHNAERMRALYLSMEIIGWYVIVPFSVAALLSGLLQSLSSQWGLFKHWWIVAKFVLTIFAVLVLLRHMGGVSRIANESSQSKESFRHEFVHATAGLLVLLMAMTLAQFKPWGTTSYGRRKLKAGGI